MYCNLESVIDVVVQTVQYIKIKERSNMDGLYNESSYGTRLGME